MLIFALARTPGTLLHRAMAGDDWTLEQHLLAFVIDMLAAANWQRGGGKGNRPKPVSPITRRHREVGGDQSGDVGGLTQDEITDLLEKQRTGAFDSGG